ncbi:probable ATP-dependent DNA helicase HFM1 isoform X2 [Daktulosphaira vitifoliae]|uniref:probable ATP-dependent DNA helicase HFM1 isoform X2 n=1 Tax=Daktulosphaira vitifoliae TaxID=58002 RepID=UPI0021A9C861|nr:probable ATP-dependent DNA helicase HFM1 isoform X2 [Daktulosphaira vitifoliae]
MSNKKNNVLQTPLCSTTIANKLFAVTNLPQNYRDLFSNYTHFNRIQTTSIETLLYTDNSVVVCAPTGCGKTVIFEIAIVRLLESCNKTNDEIRRIKIIYVAPIKAICSERYQDWHNKFSKHGLTSIEITGDTESFVDSSIISQYQIIITTPEKLDLLMRRSNFIYNSTLFNAFKLFLIDETTKSLRFIAVSATLSNVEDIANWLSVDSKKPAYCFRANEDERPVKLKKIVKGYCSSTNGFGFDLHLSYKIEPLIKKYSNNRPTLIFCSTRMSVQTTSEILSRNLNIPLCEETRNIIDLCTKNLRDDKLRDVIRFGVGFHHAGMVTKDRGCVEQLFRSGHLPVLVTTSTLAMGVNFPAHLVIIKSTEHYDFNEYKEYPQSQILQMIGRAGRPQYDETATAIIMTRNSTKEKYEILLAGNCLVESNLHKNLIDHLNTEISCRTIDDVSVVKNWIRSTFLYVRACKSPQNYSMLHSLNPKEVENQLHNLCLEEIKKLFYNGLVNVIEERMIYPNAEGEIMAKYMISFETIKTFMTLKGNEDLRELIRILANCKEFESIKLRNKEKRILNNWNKSESTDDKTIRFPIEGGIKTRQDKINCLLQATLGSLNITDKLLAQDANRIEKISICLANALKEIVPKKNNFIGARATCILLKCVNVKLWENSKHITKQMTGIGPILSEFLVKNEIISIQAILNTNPRDIERILGRLPPFGNRIKNFIKQIPMYKLLISYKKNSNNINFEISLMNPENVVKRSRDTVALLVGDSINCLLKILHKQNVDFFKDESQVVRTSVYLENLNKPNVKGHNYSIAVCLISDKWVGNDIEIILPLINNSDFTKVVMSGENDSLDVSQQIEITNFMKKKNSSFFDIENKTIGNINVENNDFSAENKNLAQVEKNYSSDNIAVFDEHNSINEFFEGDNLDYIFTNIDDYSDNSDSFSLNSSKNQINTTIENQSEQKKNYLKSDNFKKFEIPSLKIPIQSEIRKINLQLNKENPSKPKENTKSLSQRIHDNLKTVECCAYSSLPTFYPSKLKNNENTVEKPKKSDLFIQSNLKMNFEQDIKEKLVNKIFLPSTTKFTQKTIDCYFKQSKKPIKRLSNLKFSDFLRDKSESSEFTNNDTGTVEKQTSDLSLFKHFQNSQKLTLKLMNSSKFNQDKSIKNNL